MEVYLLYQVLQKAAQKTPDAPAVKFNENILTFRELDNASNALASELQRNGIIVGDRVALILDKSLNSLIAIYAVLKTGACYVPIDVRSPVKRIMHVVDDSQVKAVISSAKFLNQPDLKISPDIIILTPDSNFPKGSLDHKFFPPENLIDTDLAYILYTSGSTGLPKGVAHTHRAALTFVSWALGYFVPSEQDRFSSHAPFHFDLSIFDIFVSASCGACVYLIPSEIAIFPRSLAQWISTEEISIWYSAPSALIQLLLNGGLEPLNLYSLKHVLFAGEVFPIKFLKAFQKLVPRAELYNLYGPTETNVCTFYKVPRLLESQLEEIPIGKACLNMDVFAVNESGEIAGVNEVGELYVRGSGIMKGYWGDKIKTNLVLSEYRLDSGNFDKIYRTGDLVRKDSLGYYHFLGRRDRQIKSRGYRIELGDVESALLSHPLINSAYVTTIKDDIAGHLLHASLVLIPNHVISKKEILEYCSSILPSYMIPVEFYQLEEFPLTSTGKLDRQKLGKTYQGEVIQ